MSGYLNVPISNDVCFSGEVGLTGEVRAVSNLERRISEAKKMGFKTIFVPYMKMEKTEGINVIRIKNIIELMDIFKN
jgi:Lon protease (S16) C-terminal proteolytic domain.